MVRHFNFSCFKALTTKEFFTYRYQNFIGVLSFVGIASRVTSDRSDGHISEDSAARILRTAYKQAGIIGVSTHSFRRIGLTQMSNARIPLRVIQEISGDIRTSEFGAVVEIFRSE